MDDPIAGRGVKPVNVSGETVVSAVNSEEAVATVVIVEIVAVATGKREVAAIFLLKVGGAAEPTRAGPGAGARVRA